MTRRTFTHEATNVTITLKPSKMINHFDVEVIQGGFVSEALTTRGIWSPDKAQRIFDGLVETLQGWSVEATVEPTESAKVELAQIVEIVIVPANHMFDDPSFSNEPCDLGLHGCATVGNRRSNPLAKLPDGRDLPRYIVQCLPCHETLCQEYIDRFHRKA